MKRTPWPEDDVQRLKSLLADGKPPNQIAAVLGRSADAVRCKMAREGLESPVSPGRPRKLDYAEIGRLADAGWRRFEVARVHGRSAEQVFDLVKR